MNERLSDLQDIVKLIKKCNRMSDKKRASYFQKHNSNKNTYYNYKNKLEVIEREIAFIKEWKKVLTTHRSTLSQYRTVSKKVSIAIELIETEIGTEFKARKKDVKTHIQKMFAANKQKRRKRTSEKPKPPSIDEKINTLEPINVEIDLSQFKVQQTYCLGMLEPYPKGRREAYTLQFRLDLVALEGPWQDLEQTRYGKGVLTQKEIKYIGAGIIDYILVEHPKGTSETHRTGLIVMVLTPCYFESKIDGVDGVQNATDRYNLRPTREIEEWDTDALFDPIRVQKLLDQVFECQDKSMLAAMDSEHTFSKSHPLHPSNFKTTIERRPEFIQSLNQRVLPLREDNDLQKELDKTFLSPVEYIERYSSKYKYKPPEYFNEEMREYIENRYLTKEKTKARLDSATFNEWHNQYKRDGYERRVMMLSNFFTFSSEMEMLRQVGLAIHYPFREYINYQLALKYHLYDEETQKLVGVMKYSSQFDFDFQNANPICGYAQYRLHTKQRSLAEKLFTHGGNPKKVENGFEMMLITMLQPIIEDESLGIQLKTNALMDNLTTYYRLQSDEQFTLEFIRYCPIFVMSDAVTER